MARQRWGEFGSAGKVAKFVLVGSHLGHPKICFQAQMSALLCPPSIIFTHFFLLRVTGGCWSLSKLFLGKGCADLKTNFYRKVGQGEEVSHIC